VESYDFLEERKKNPSYVRGINR